MIRGISDVSDAITDSIGLFVVAETELMGRNVRVPQVEVIGFVDIDHDGQRKLAQMSWIGSANGEPETMWEVADYDVRVDDGDIEATYFVMKQTYSITKTFTKEDGEWLYRTERDGEVIGENRLLAEPTVVDPLYDLDGDADE